MVWQPRLLDVQECPPTPFFLELNNHGSRVDFAVFIECLAYGQKRAKFGQIINSSHSSIIHSNSKNRGELGSSFEKSWRQIRRSTCIPLAVLSWFYFFLLRLEKDTYVCCTLLTTTNYITGAALKDRFDSTAMTKQLFSRYKMSSQCFFPVISSKKIQQVGRKWPMAHRTRCRNVVGSEKVSHMGPRKCGVVLR